MVFLQELSDTSFIYCVRNIFQRVWTHINVLTNNYYCVVLILTLYTESFAELIVYLTFCYRSATASSTSPREQTEGAKNLPASRREATPPMSPTPDQTSQVRANHIVLTLHYIGSSWRGGVRLLRVNHPSLSLSLFVPEKGWHHILGSKEP